MFVINALSAEISIFGGEIPLCPWNYKIPNIHLSDI